MLSQARPSDATKRGDARQLHVAHQLCMQEVEGLFNTALPERSKSPAKRTTYADCVCTQRKRLEYIRSTTYASIDKDRYSPVDNLDHLGQTLDSTPITFQLPSAMIRHDDAIGAVFQAKLGVLSSYDAF